MIYANELKDEGEDIIYPPYTAPDALDKVKEIARAMDEFKEVENADERQ